MSIIKRILSLVLAVCLCCAGINTIVFADTESVIFVNETFNEFTTNITPEELDITPSEAGLIEEKGENNKVLSVRDTGGVTRINFPGLKNSKTYVISADFEKVGGSADFSFGTYYKSTKVSGLPINVKGNMIYTSDGRKIGNLKRGVFTNIALAIDTAHGVYDVYIDGKRALRNWKLPINLSTFDNVIVQRSSGEGTIYIDNVRAYSGSKLRDDLPEAAFNTKSTLNVPVNFSPGDKMFINSNLVIKYDNSWTGSKYPNTNLNMKSNSIDAHLLRNREDINRTDNDIVFTKTTEEDCHMDTVIESTDALRFPYILVRAEAKIDKMGAVAHPVYIRDSSSGATQVNEDAFIISSKGQASLKTGKVVKKLKAGEWFSYAFVFDMRAQTYDCYIDGKLAEEDIALPANLKQINMVRVSLDAGSAMGDFTIRNYEVTGLQKPYDPDNEVWTSIWPDDSVYVEYLADKTSFHAYGGLVMVDGVKHYPEFKPVWNNDDKELYVDAEALNYGYGLELAKDETGTKLIGSGLEITADSTSVVYNDETIELQLKPYIEDGHLLVPVKDFAKNVLKHYVVDDGFGMILTSENEFYIDLENEIPEYLIGSEEYHPDTAIKGLNSFLFFERAKPDQIKEMFNEHIGNDNVHPRVIATKDDFDRVRDLYKTNPVITEWVDIQLAKADDLLDDPHVQYKTTDGLQMIDKARQFLAFMENLGFAYQMTGEQKYVDRAYSEMENIISFPDWNPTHTIDMGEFLASMAIGYDWMYDALTPEQRQYIFDGVREKGLSVMQMIYYGRADYAYYLWKSNFNAVVNGGIMTAALAFAEYDPDLCFDLVYNTLRSMEYAMYGFVPSGAWCESVAYWDYTLSYMSKGLSTLKNCTGTIFNYLNYQGLPETGDWLIAVDSPQGTNNYHDCGHDDNVWRFMSSRMGWLAAEQNKPYLAAYRYDTVMKGETPEIYDILWYDPDINYDDPFSDLKLDQYFPDGLEVISMREDYSDSDGLYFSTHAGVVDCYHSHNDTGTYVLDLNGQRWACDLGAEYYDIENAVRGWEQSYRRRAESHNLIVFNPGQEMGQDRNQYVGTVAFESKDRGAYAIYDMTPAYASKVTDYKRGFMVNDDRRSLTVRDEFQTKTAMPLYWFMMTEAEIEIVDNNTAILSRGGEQLKLEIICEGGNGSLSWTKAEPLPTSPSLYQRDLSRYRRIAYNVASNGEPMSITAKMSILNEKASETPIFTKPIAEWSLDDIPDGELPKRDIMSLKTIYVDGVNIDDLTPNHQLMVVEGEPMPEITAVATDPEKTPEIIPAASPREKTLIRVWNREHDRYRDVEISYKVTYKPAALDNYTKVDVQDVVVSSTPEPQNHMLNMLDGDFNTRWTTMKVGEWAKFDLGTPKEFDAVALAFWLGNERIYNFDVQVSADGNNWETVATGCNDGSGEDLILVRLGKQNARYIQVIGKGSNANVNTNILEFVVLQEN